jgi:hypothetical protein
MFPSNCIYPQLGGMYPDCLHSQHLPSYLSECARTRYVCVYIVYHVPVTPPTPCQFSSPPRHMCECTECQLGSCFSMTSSCCLGHRRTRKHHSHAHFCHIHPRPPPSPATECICEGVFFHSQTCCACVSVILMAHAHSTLFWTPIFIHLHKF